MTTRRTTARVTGLLLTMTLAATAAACSSSSPSDSPAAAKPGNAAPPAADADLAALLPADFKGKGTIVWGVEPYFPPFQMTGDDNKTLVGVDIDLANEISGLLGVKAEIAEAKFDALIPGIQADRYDLVIDAMSDTAERRELVSFVDYFQGGSAIFVTGENPHKVSTMDDLCGLNVGAVKGSFQVEDAEAQAKKCAADGKAVLTPQVYPDQAGMLLALTSNRSDAMLMDSAAGSYAAKQSNGQFIPTGSLTSPKRKGIVVSKTNTELMEAVQKAMQKLMDNGKYEEILKKWGQEGGAIKTATINDGKGTS